MDTLHWHLQLSEREWVIWGYGRDGYEHIEPALVRIREIAPGLDLDFPFQLPKPFKGSGKPQEYRRVTCWGWRFKSNDLIHDAGWHLAETRAQALSDARAWAEREDARDGSVRHGHRAPWTSVLADIREWEA